MRHPSMYMETEVSLLSYNPSDSTLTKILTLADNVGDMGWVCIIKSWIKDFNGDGQPDIIKHRSDFIPTYGQEQNNIIRGRQFDSIFFYEGKANDYKKCYVAVIIDSMKSDNGRNSLRKVKTLKSDTLFYQGKKTNLIDFIKYRQ